MADEASFDDFGVVEHNHVACIDQPDDVAKLAIGDRPGPPVQMQEATAARDSAGCCAMSSVGKQ